MTGITTNKTVMTAIALTMALAAPVAAEEFTLTVDVPSGLGGTDYLASQTVLRSSGGYSLGFDGPANGMGPDISINAVLVLEDGDLLFSTDAPFSVAGSTFEARDIVRESAGSFSLEQSGAALGLGSSCNIDALSRDAAGNLLISFDVPETVNVTTYEPDDIVKIEAGELSIFVSGDAIRLPDGANVVGYSFEDDGDSYFLFETPLTIGASTYLPGEVVRYDGVSFSSFFSDPGFPEWAAGWGFSLAGAPGAAIDLTLNKNLAQVDLSWSAGCSEQQNDFAVYEGTLGAFATHDMVQCSTGGDTFATVAPQAGDRYFLVVPQNGAYEGSYGTDSLGGQRGAGLTVCQLEQKLRDCP